MQLYRQVAQQDKNSIFSPYSLMVAMSMVLAGSRGNTAKQLIQALHFDQMEILDIHTSMMTLSKRIDKNANNATCKFKDANCIFSQKNFQVLPLYLKLVRDFYHSDVKGIDFTDPTSAANIVNEWVDRMTNHKIQKLLTPDDISPMTKMILSNAIYFKGKWKFQFDKSNVIEKPFHYDTNNHVIVKMMSQKMKINYLQDRATGIQMIELPYECNKMSMILILPESIELFSGLKETVLSNGNLDKWIKSMNKMDVNVKIPKFVIKQKMDLNDVLQKLGVTDLFDMNRADLSGISQIVKLYVGKVIQEAHLEVNEEGSEAAAATGVIILAKMMAITPEFIADRPFIYIIRDIKNNTILFMGHVTKPEDS